MSHHVKSFHGLNFVWFYSFLVNVNIEDKWGEHPNVRFNDDGTITDTQLEIVNLKMDGQWETVGESLCFCQFDACLWFF